MESKLTIPVRDVCNTVNDVHNVIKKYLPCQMPDPEGTVYKDRSKDFNVSSKIVFRHMTNLLYEEATQIVDNGCVCGSIRKGLTYEVGKRPTDDELKKAVEQGINQFKTTYGNDLQKIAKAGMSHKSAAHGESLFVSTTSDVNYTYGLEWNPLYQKKKKVYLAIAIVPTKEQVYCSKELADIAGSGYGVSNEAGDYESEWLFGGGILSESIVYAVIHKFYA